MHFWKVAPLVGAWIEIFGLVNQEAQAKSLLL